ncbi:MAG: IctB family putative bicarbonate transporter [Cyanobacteria bacterium P01_A01_bin.45]
MNLVWQLFTFSDISLKDYLRSSYLHRFTVGLLSSWRQGSILIQWGDAIAAGLISLLFALAPLVSTTLIGVMLIACAAFWFLLTVSDDTKSNGVVGVTPIHVLVFAYWGVAVISTALSPEKKAALTDLRTLSLYLLLFPLCAKVLRSPRLRSWLITIYLLTALNVSIYGLRQKIFGAAQLATWVDPTSTLSKVVRVYSYLGNPNLLAGYILPAIILSLVACFAWRTWQQKALAGTMFVVNLACLRFTDSRGGLIALGASLIVLVFLLRYWYAQYLHPFWRLWLLPMIMGAFAALIVGALIFSEQFRLRILSIFAGRSDSSNNFRINVWNAVFRMIGDYPLFGIGPGHNSFNKIYPLYQIPKYNALSAYSIFLEIAVETGFVGLAVFLWLLIVTSSIALRQLGRLRKIQGSEGLWLIAAIATLAGMVAHNLVDTVWYRPQVNTIWWLMMGLVASYYTPKHKRAKISSPNPQPAAS